MRPRSALRRPPSASRPMTSTEKAAHRFAHNLRERISLQRHVKDLPDACEAPLSASQLTGETDAEFFSVLRNREDRLRTTMHAAASCATPEAIAEAIHSLPELQPDALLTGADGCARPVDDQTLLLESWRDEDGVLTDEPRMLRLLPEDGTGVPCWVRFAQGCLTMSSLCAAGVIDAAHSPHGVALHRLVVDPYVTDGAQQQPRRLEHLLLRKVTQHGKSGQRQESIGRAPRVPRPPSQSGERIDVPRVGSRHVVVASMDCCATKAKCVRELGVAGRRARIIVAEPFSDAEIFQWFYLQLVLKALLDASLDPSIIGGDVSVGPLRVDYMRVFSSRAQQLAFGHPMDDNRYVVFPPQSHHINLSTFEAISFGRSVGGVRLLGAQQEADLPCVSRFGRHVVDKWAAGIVLQTPADAQKRLAELFDLFIGQYGCERSQLLNAAVAPKVFTCGRRAHRRLKTHPWLGTRVVDVADGGAPQVANRSASDGAQAVPERSEPQGRKTAAAARDDCSVLHGKWEAYVSTGDVSVFQTDSAYPSLLDCLSIGPVLGKGGSGVVFQGHLRHPSFSEHQPLPVAIKVYVYPDGLTQEEYVKESLTDVAFFTVFNELDASRICPGVRCYDFFVTAKPLLGAGRDIPDALWKHCLHHHATPEAARLCFLVSDRADATLGRFLTPEDDDYDPGYDTLVNTPMDDVQVFVFLYTQLVLRSALSYHVHDVMLYGQLRGDNLGLVSVRNWVDRARSRHAAGHRKVEEDSHSTSAQRYLWVRYDRSASPSPSTYLRFPIDLATSKLVLPIDVGQGVLPQVSVLHDEHHLIGAPTVESCLVDDGMGRYWPAEELYAKDVAASGRIGKEALKWASTKRVSTSQEALHALFELLERYASEGFATTETDRPDDTDYDDGLVWTCEEQPLMEAKRVILHRLTAPQQ